jgi:hypothetical protein
MSFAIAALLGCGSSRDPALGGQETLAFVMCQTPVSAQLRAPSNARFPYITAPGVRAEHIGDGVYKVRGFVDAQNGFGAMIRTQWTCEIEETPDHEWSLRKLEIEE